MPKRRDDVYSNDLEGAAYHEAQFAELPEEFWDARREADQDEEQGVEEEDEGEEEDDAD
tara:strand:- start:4663 stop:4839 length:177 start_codon:yes stop_codon:yes gene_type:complete